MNGTVSPQEILKFMTLSSEAKAYIIDVRSECEFEEGHIPSTINIPILNNVERAAVGTTFKKQGQSKAIDLGHELVGPYREARTRKWQNALISSNAVQKAVMCWRGGLRSRTAQTWLGESGTKVQTITGGYKALRAELLAAIQNLPPLIVLSGLTGSGKTKLLTELLFSKIDLESLANHRGSLFGGSLVSSQPRQASFENALGLELLKHGGAGELVVEDESSRIGQINVPPILKNTMAVSPVIFLDSPLEERVKHIFGEYVMEPLENNISPAHLLTALESNLLRLQRRLGGLITSEILGELRKGFSHENQNLENHFEWIKRLLTEHYDKAYQFAFDRQTRPILFRGDHKSCLQFLNSMTSDYRKQ